MLPHPPLSTRGKRGPDVPCFPSPLGVTLAALFHGLPNSIRSFDELAGAFTAVRLRQKGRRGNHGSGSASDDKMKASSGFGPFHCEARRIPHLSDELKLNAFVATLAAGDFFKHLSYQRPQTFREAETIARVYITAEEANEAKRPERVDRPPEAPRASGGRKRDSDSLRYSERRKQQRPPPGPKKDYSRTSLTPLNDSRANILMQIQDEKFFKWPKRPEGPKWAGRSTASLPSRSGHPTENRTTWREIEERSGVDT
ncbi:hypothetical protein Nepgr_031450 [Nepenthes gracilis]|uniref:Uncharacterized protein n=1 Tax=Nepenthes gracilis TaxID=150966 RepID=A0AAD3Y4T6_NEPGR|nr:hypothetical protein Nepgr_031450 [Nepenthes gracilis]